MENQTTETEFATMYTTEPVTDGWNVPTEINDVTENGELTSSLSHSDIKLFMAMSLASKILYPAIGVTGSILNTLVIATYAKFKALRTPTNTFLLSLTAADLCMSLYLVIARFIGTVKDDMIFRVIYTFLFVLHAVALTSSLATTVVIAIHRIVAVKHPIKFKTIFSLRTCCCIVLGIWLTCSLIIGSLVIYYLSSTDAVVLRNLLTTSDVYPQIIVLIFVQIYPYACVIISALLYIIIFYNITKKIRSVSPNPAAPLDQNVVAPANNSILKDKKLALLTCTILIVFLICWLPISLYTSIASESYIKSPHGRLGYMITVMMLQCNAIFNVCAFVYFSKTFRNKMLVLLCCKHE